MPTKKKAKSPKPESPSKSPAQPTEDIKDAYYGTIEIHVYYLDCKLEPGMYTLVIVYANNYIGRVGRIHVPEGGGRVDINRKFYLYIKAMDNYIMDTLLSTPFFFSLIKGENKADPKLFPKLGFSAAIQTNVEGQGNLGIMPLLTGQFEMESLIILEPPGIQDIYYFERKFSEHPRLYVKLVDGKKNLSAKELNNIMWLSVESVYNLDRSDFLQDAEHTLVFPMPTKSIDEEHALLEEFFAVGEELYEEVKSEPKKSSKKGKPKTSTRKKSPKNKKRESNEAPKRIEIKKPQDFDLIQFDRGIYKIERTPDIRKKWSSLASINGAPAMTDQRILTDTYDLISTVPFDVVKKYRSCIEPRIEWNMVRPIWLHEDLEILMKERIIQYGVWPVEVLMLGKVYLGRKQLMKSQFKEDKKTLDFLKSEIDNILTEFHEIIESFDTDEDDTQQGDIASRLSELAVRIQELLSKYGKKPKRNIEADEQDLHDKSNSKSSREGSASSEEFESETYEDSNEFLKEDSVVVLERKSYIVWIDLSPLLVPGCTHLRTAGALQHFNRAEAVAKWGLTNTFSGDTEKMSTSDKELDRMLRRETTDLNKIYMDLKKKKLMKCPTKSLLLLERLLELSHKIKKIESEPKADPETQVFSSHVTVDEDKKKTKSEKFRDDKKKLKVSKVSKVKPDGLVKEKTNARNLSPKTGQLKKDSTSVVKNDRSDDTESEDALELETDSLTGKVFDFNVIRKKISLEKKTPINPRIGAVSSAINREQLIEEKGEEENMLKINTMKHYFNRPPSHSKDLFTANKTDKVKQGKNIESLKRDASPVEEISVMQSMESSPADLSSSSESSITDLKKLTDSKLMNRFKSDQKTPDKQLRNELELQSPVEDPPKKTSSQVQSSKQTMSPEMSQLNEEEPLLELLKSLLVTVINKYQKLKDRYKVLKKNKVKEGVFTLGTSDLETVNLPSANDKTGDICDEYSPLNDELRLIKVDPRHKMWQVGQHLNDELMDDQIQYTNDVRKMAVLENEFLLLKRLRLAQMKQKWERELKNIMPQYLENSKGEKVIVIIDIKLLKPLVPKPKLAEIDFDIQDFIKVRETKKSPVYYANDTVAQFHNCIANLSNLITSEYKDFKKSYVSVINPLSGETGNEFYEYLEKSRAHQIITESLSETMKGYLASALRDPIPTADKNDQKKLRYYVGWLYSRVVEEMQAVVNKIIIEGDPSLPETNFGDLPTISNYDRYLFAVEAIEEMDYDRAKYYLAKRLEGNNVNEPQLWIDYAVIALRIGDYQRAMECIKESLILDSRYKEGLIMYAVMLMTEGRFEDAQIFFNALINFYPMFVEGWMAFHMFYLIIENKTGADITLVAGTKVSYDFKLPTPMKPPQLSWDNKTWIEEEPGNYISTAIYFLSFNMYEIAEVCLARELERVGTKTLVWVYYLSVCHYIQGRYEDSAKHLSKAIQELHDYNMDPRIWMLLGHNCWMMGLKKCGIQMYLQSFTKKNENLFDHMTYIRCGFFFLEKEHSKFAKQMFLRAVRQQSTPMGWLGLGIALFMEGKIEDAELALKEANMLDTTLATAWGYLALVSLYKLKEEQFMHCFREAKRYGLDDKKLLFQIEIISQQIESYRKSKLCQNSQNSL